MKRLIATFCLLLPLASLAATPPGNPATATTTEMATNRAELDSLQQQMQQLAQRMATLSARVGKHARSRALRYLSDSKRGMLGMAVSPDNDGMRVDAVTPGGPAERAGLQTGDVISAIDGKQLSSADASGRDGFSDLHAGKPVKLTVRRDGKTVHIAATPERFQADDWQGIERAIQMATSQATARLNSPAFKQQLQQAVEAATDAATNARSMAIEMGKHARRWHINAPWWGLNLASLNPGLGHYFGTDHGALVLSRDAKRYPKLEPGDVITKIAGRTVANPADAMRAFRQAPDDKPVTLHVRRHGKALTLAIKSPPRWMVLPPPPPPAPPAPPVAPPAPPAPPVAPPAPPPPSGPIVTL